MRLVGLRPFTTRAAKQSAPITDGAVKVNAFAGSIVCVGTAPLRTDETSQHSHSDSEHTCSMKRVERLVVTHQL